MKRAYDNLKFIKKVHMLLTKFMRIQDGREEV